MKTARCLGFSLLILAPLTYFSAANAEEQKPVIADGKKVSIEYSITLDDGTTVDSNVGEDALSYVHGEGQLFSALERELIGLKVNDTKKVKLSPEEGFGNVNNDAFLEVEPASVPEEARKVGVVLVTQGPTGEQLYVRVHEVRDDKIILDLNHPLAGQSLNFDVRVVAIE